MSRKKNIFFCFAFLFFGTGTFFSQKTTYDLSKLTDDTPKEFTKSTFNTTRLINFHTVEVTGKRSLDFRISHRFGDINGGSFNAWGLDGGANIRLALEYCHDGRFQFGIGRTSVNKITDGFLKFRLLRQTTNNKMPLSITLFSGAYYTFEKVTVGNIDKYQNVSDRMSYCNQILISRKFNWRFSLQLIGAMVHNNLVEKISDWNDCYVAGFVAQFKFTKHQAITVEYAHRINKYSKDSYYDSFGIGYDIETGGHVFQLHFTNSFGLTENQYYMYTNTSWSKMGVRLGFNISRIFNVASREKQKEWSNPK